jgi:hypothetical protein
VACSISMLGLSATDVKHPPNPGPGLSRLSRICYSAGCFAWGCARLQVMRHEWAYSSVMARAAQIAQIIIWAVILILGVLAYWSYLELAPMD